MDDQRPQRAVPGGHDSSLVILHNVGKDGLFMGWYVVRSDNTTIILAETAQTWN